MSRKKSISQVSLRRRIWIAVALISIIPILILTYSLFGYHISLWIVRVLMGVLILVILLGWWVIFEIFSSIIRLYAQSRVAIEDIGEESPKVSNEVQTLETVINMLSNKVKTSFGELKDFTQKTEQLNHELTKKVLILSAILQANDLFSRDAPDEEIVNFLTDQLKKVLETNVCFCILQEEAIGNLKSISLSGLDPLIMEAFIAKRKVDLPSQMDLASADAAKQPKLYQQWAKDLELASIAIAPIISRGQVMGMLGVGNNQADYVFSKDEMEILNLFSQNVTLTWEHKRLSSRIEELEIVDHLTGLYNEKMITSRLDEEIERSGIYQRPCGFITVTLSDYDDYQKNYGLIEAEKILKKIAYSFKRSLRSIDIPARIGPKTLGAILIETNKRCCQEVLGKIEDNLGKIIQGKLKLSFSAAESPLDGATAAELINSSLKPMPESKVQ